MFKTIGMFLLTAMLSLSLQAKPAQQEQHEYCASIAEAFFVGATVKAGGMSEEVFLKGLAEDEKRLDASPDLTKKQLTAMKAAIRLGYKMGNPNLTEAMYTQCMSQKTT